MPPRLHSLVDLAALLLVCLALAPEVAPSTALLAPAAVGLRELLGGYDPRACSAWAIVSVLFAVTGAQAVLAVGGFAGGAWALALLWAAAVAALALVQIATRIVSLRTAPFGGCSASRNP